MNRNNILFAWIAFLAVVLAGCGPGVSAVMNGDSVQLQQILDKPNHGNVYLDNLECYAVNKDCGECVRELLEAGAKPECLADAVTNGNEKIARLLIAHGAEPTAAMAKIDGVRSPSQVQDARNLFDRIAQARSLGASSSVPSSVAAAGARSHLKPSFQGPVRAHDYALIIGVEKYDSLPSATYAEGDAETAADFVRALGVPARNVVTLTDSHATRSSMVKQLENWLAKNADESSTVYFYFSGHGAPDPATGQAYLVPFDGDPQYLAETAYPLKRLYEKLGALKSKRTIVMIDSCFSGAGGRSVLAKGTRPLVNNIDTGFNSAGGNIAVLTASGANQISGTNDENGHGLFTYYLFNGLNGAAEDSSGNVTLQSLYNYLKPKVMDDARRANGDQTPELKADSVAFTSVLRKK